MPNVQAVPGGVGKAEWIDGVTEQMKVFQKKAHSMLGVAETISMSCSCYGDYPTEFRNLTSSYYALATRTKQKRPDVAKALKAPVFENSSYQLDGDISAVPPGKYLISILLSDG